MIGHGLMIGNRKTIREIFDSGYISQFPKYGDFLVRYSRCNSACMHVVEIFKGFTEDGYIDCLTWWNFDNNRGTLYNPNTPMLLGGGSDTYFANNYEIKLLMKKFKSAGYKWDFDKREMVERGF